jgi:hypothetical protein
MEWNGMKWKHGERNGVKWKYGEWNGNETWEINKCHGEQKKWHEVWINDMGIMGKNKKQGLVFYFINLAYQTYWKL